MEEDDGKLKTGGGLTTWLTHAFFVVFEKQY
jgi:hypothetical protein